ncbi:MAG: hypothetical protein QXI16_06845, partial [Sulfolobaceae archaeon]
QMPVTNDIQSSIEVWNELKAGKTPTLPPMYAVGTTSTPSLSNLFQNAASSISNSITPSTSNTQQSAQTLSTPSNPQNLIASNYSPQTTQWLNQAANYINYGLHNGRGDCCGIPDPYPAYKMMTTNASFTDPNQVGILANLAFEGAGSDIHKHGRSVGHTWNSQAITQDVNSLFNPTLTPDEQAVFQNEYNAGKAALNNLKQPANLSMGNTSTASANALGGNVKTPQVLASDIAGVQNINQTNLTNYQNEINTGMQILNSLNNPQTQQAFAMQYMANTLTNVFQYLGMMGDKDISQYAQNLSNVISSNNQFNTQATQFFNTILGLQYDLPSKLMQAFNNQNSIAQKLVQMTT